MTYLNDLTKLWAFKVEQEKDKKQDHTSIFLHTYYHYIYKYVCLRLCGCYDAVHRHRPTYLALSCQNIPQTTLNITVSDKLKTASIY